LAYNYFTPKVVVPPPPPLQMRSYFDRVYI